MKRTECIIGVLGILLILVAIFYYQIFEVVKPAKEPVVIESEERELRGYEDPLDTVAYLMAHIEKGELEPALRSCAIEDVAGYADLSEYLNYTGNYQGTDMIPMVDSNAYYEITKLRLASDYGHMIQKCIEFLAMGKELEIRSIVRDEPENPDGKYYQRLERINGILGTRDVCECIVSMSVDGRPVELHLSLAKYKRFWKVILFTPMVQYQSREPDIRIIDEGFGNMGTVAMDLSSYLEDLLPLNYSLLNSRHGEDATEMLDECWIYFQRGDVLSVLTYFDFGNSDKVSQFSLELLDRQKEAAVQLQDFYYEMLLYHADLEWAKRHYEDEPGYIQEFLRIGNMQYVRVRSIEVTEKGNEYVTYFVKYSYDGKEFSRNLMMSNDNGWKILEMNKPKT